MNKILSLIILVLIMCACSEYKFIDRRSSYKEWDDTPMNSKYLRIIMVDSATSKEVNGRLYYIAPYRGDNPYIIDALVEVNTNRNVMNIFPLPSNKSSIDMTNDNLFPPPSMILKALRISAEYKEDTGIFIFKTFPFVRGSEIVDSITSISEKKVILNYKQKCGTLIDKTGDSEHKIWF